MTERSSKVKDLTTASQERRVEAKAQAAQARAVSQLGRTSRASSGAPRWLMLPISILRLNAYHEQGSAWFLPRLAADLQEVRCTRSEIDEIRSEMV